MGRFAQLMGRQHHGLQPQQGALPECGRKDGPGEEGHGTGRVCLIRLQFGACLFQVAEMHGELIEFNERLHRALVAKEALVSQMRQELIDLRGPVSAAACRQCLSVDLASAALFSSFIIGGIKGIEELRN